jgi:hypothetical protein
MGVLASIQESARGDTTLVVAIFCCLADYHFAGGDWPAPSHTRRTVIPDKALGHTHWTLDDAWLLHASVLSGLTSVGTLMRTADHLRHDLPGADLAARALTKFANAGLIAYGRDALVVTKRAVDLVSRANRSDLSLWQPGGPMEQTLHDLEGIDPGGRAAVPDAYWSWYDVLDRGGRHGRRHRLGLGRW